MGDVTILCLASYEKGADFLRECRRLGCRVLLITVDGLKDAAWPREEIDGFWHVPDEAGQLDIVHAVSWLNRTERIDRIVALDEFDLETAAVLRGHLRIPGLDETATRDFRDKLAMRERARAGGVPVPDFVGVLNHDAVRAFLERVPPPWVLKPRTEASAIGIRKLHAAAEVWPLLEQLGDRQSFHLIEAFVPGHVYHVDSIVAEGRVVFAEAHRYASPPFDVMHAGGLFCSRTLPRDDEEVRFLLDLNQHVVRALSFQRGVLHTEFIGHRDGGDFHFLETAARVGGANIVEMVEAATGINLWHEWARLEVADVRREPYEVPVPRAGYAGVLISLARQEWPDTGAYVDPEVVWRMSKRHHAGVIVASPGAARVEALLENYMTRFYADFYATLPAPDKPTA